MTTPENLHVSFCHKGTDYNLDLIKGKKSDQTVQINGVTYTVLGDKEKLESACKILSSLQLDTVSSLQDLANILSLRGDFSQVKLTHDTALPILIPSAKVSPETVPGSKMPEIMPHTFTGDGPSGIYQTEDGNRSFKFVEKDGHLFEIGIGDPEKPTECLLLKNGSFQLKDPPLTLKYDKYADSITIEENEKVTHSLKPRPLNLSGTVDKLCTLLEKYYIFPEIAKKCSDDLHKKFKSGAYDQFSKGTDQSISDPKNLCEALTKDLRKVSHDEHMGVSLSTPDLESSPPSIKEVNGPYSIPDLFKPRKYKSMLKGGDSYIPYEIQTGFLSEDLKVGYVDFRVFGNPKYMGDKPKEGQAGYEQMLDFENRKSELIAAVNNLKVATTVIIDLRNNGGGHYNGVQLMCSLFNIDKERPLSRIEWREGDARRTKDVYTLTYEELPEEQRLLTQRVMILIGPKTFSAAEAFANDMRVFQRATIVGQPSGGGANPSDGLYAVGELEFRIPEGEAVNPIQKMRGERNWEGVGIIPDIRVPASEALNKAIAVVEAEKKEKKEEKKA